MVWSRRKQRKCNPAVEALDGRCLLSVAGLTPAQIGTAYGLTGLSFGGRVADGSGQTIAVIDAYNDPNLAAELATFDQAYNLPAPPSLTIVGQSGSATPPRSDPGWAQEEALDVEWAHAIAPGAALVLVEASSTRLTDFLTAVKTASAIPGVTVVSMSWGDTETARSATNDSDFTASGVTFVAASGDDGPANVEWPASSPLVLGVGGTTLQVDGSGNYGGETAWSGSSGGYSSFELEPAYQMAVQSSGMRSVPDVSFDGNPNSGVEVYTISLSTGQGSWVVVGGTSLGAPAWAGLIALADQGRAVNGLPPLSSTQSLTALYSLPATAFHTIEGTYNTQTGLGTPAGAALIDGLVAYDPGVTSPPVVTPPVTPPPVTAPPIGGDPIIRLPILTMPVNIAPVVTTPVANVPVSTLPISSAPTINQPPATQPNLTPPPAASPVNPLHKAPKKGAKHVALHPKPKPHRVKVHRVPVFAAAHEPII